MSPKELLDAAVREAGDEVRLIRVPGADHSQQMLRQIPGHPDWPDFQSEIASWFDRRVKRAPPTGRRPPC